MRTVFLYDQSSLIWSIAIVSVVLIVLLVAFVKIVVIDPTHDKIPYRCWPWWNKVIFQIIPGLLLIAIIGYLLFVNVGGIKCIHQWHHGEYQVVEGKISHLEVEEFWKNGAKEPNYDCSFVVDGVEFPPTNHYTAQEIETLTNGVYVRICYLYDSGNPWPWQIEVAETIIE